MNLGVILAIGESLGDLKSKGQLKRLLDYNIKRYSQAFDQVFIFSYDNEKNFKLPRNCKLVANTLGIHRYLYSILMPIICHKEIIKCDVLRGLQLSGGIPAAIGRIIYGKRFVINYGYDYSKFAKIEGKTLQSFFYELIQKPILSFADTVIVTSVEVTKILVKIIDKSKIIYIPNGVDLNLFRASENPKFQTGDEQESAKRRKREPRLSGRGNLFRSINHKPIGDTLNILYVGRLEVQKNLSVLINALALIKKSHKLTFFGQGTQKKELIRLASKLKVPLVIKPPVEYSKLPKVLSTADIFVLPSQEEGSPKILLEAMACQKAVVGSNVKGIKEIIINNYNGLLANADPKSIAVAIKKLENKNLRKQLGENARKHIIKNYEIHSLLDKEVEMLKNAAVKK